MTSAEGNKPENLSGPLLVGLHLLPGIAIAGFFFVLSWMLIQWGLTAYLALLITIPVCLVPVEIGALRLWSTRSAGDGSLVRLIVYRNKGTAIDYVVLPLLLFLCGGALASAVSPVATALEVHLSAWLPVWATQEALVDGLAAVSRAERALTLGVAVFLSGFVAPVVEELYFRGFLLPRMAHLGRAAPAVNALLFAAYHFYFPENVPRIFFAFLPVVYVVWQRRNWRIGVVTHSMFNLVGVLSLAAS